MDFKKLLSIETLAAIIGAAIVALLVDVYHFSPYWLLLLVPILIFLATFTSFKRKWRIFQSGIISFHKTMSVYQSIQHWKEAKDSFTYLGVTGSSIREELKQLLNNEQGSSRNYRFLLLDAKGDSIAEQIAFKRKFGLDCLSEEEKQVIEKERTLITSELTATIKFLKSTPAYNDNPSRLEIRLFDEFTSWWVYMIDKKKMFLGLLKRGQEGGEQSVAVLQKHPDKVNLFTSFEENFERIWRSAKEV